MSLARYICALVRKDKPEEELRPFCIGQLSVFLEGSKNCLGSLSYFNPLKSVFKISAAPQTLTGKIWVSPASFPSLTYIFWQNCASVRQVSDFILKTVKPESLLADILLTTFSTAFSWLRQKIFLSRLKFRWSRFLRVQLTSRIGSFKGLVPIRWQLTSHCLNQWRLNSLTSWDITRPEWVKSVPLIWSDCRKKIQVLCQ